MASAVQAVPRVNYVRTIPPERDLGGESVAILYLTGDVAKAEWFADTFADRASRTGILKFVVADQRQLRKGERPDANALRRLHRNYPADVYIGIEDFACSLSDQEGEGSTTNADGVRVKRRHLWTDATCRGRVLVSRARDAEPLLVFELKGEGTSPRMGRLTDEERLVALQQAAHFAAVAAADSVTPRRVRESIELVDTVPEFEHVMPLLEAGRLPAARQFLSELLDKQGASAALHFDIAAVCEAMGDEEGALQHYETAAKLAPAEPQYARALTQFRRRSLREDAEPKPRP